MRRRDLLLSALAARVPVRQITQGPLFHWFGYYDKWQFDPSSRYVLANQVSFEHRSPRPEDEIRIGMIDTAEGDRWTTLGSTTAWNWQQGCMLQWLPGSRSEIIWNARQDGRFVSHILDVKSGKRRTLPAPVYSISPDAKHALYPDFRRLNDTRPGYGYAGLPGPNAASTAPDNAGIWSLDLASGQSQLILSFAQIAAVPHAHKEAAPKPGAKHWVNHRLHSPSGRRFLFLHRWRNPGEAPFNTRLFTASPDGRKVCIDSPRNNGRQMYLLDISGVI